jgi:tetratricopeptide (TPR) repeat protein
MYIMYSFGFICLMTLFTTGCQLLVSPTDTGARHLGAGDYSKAIESLNAIEPSSQSRRLLARAHRTRAAQSLKQHRCTQALKDLEAAAAFEPRFMLDYQLTDRCFSKAKQPPPVALAEVLIESGDTRTRVLTVLLAKAYAAETFEQTNQYARTLVSRNVWKADIARWLAKKSMQLQKDSDARFWLLKLVTRQTTDAYLLSRLAMTCARLKDDELAHRYFSAAWTLKPGNRVLLSPWRAVCARRKDAACVAHIDAQTSAPGQDRQLRPLLKSKR